MAGIGAATQSLAHRVEQALEDISGDLSGGLGPLEQSLWGEGVAEALEGEQSADSHGHGGSQSFPLGHSLADTNGRLRAGAEVPCPLQLDALLQAIVKLTDDIVEAIEDITEDLDHGLLLGLGKGTLR